MGVMPPRKQSARFTWPPQVAGKKEEEEDRKSRGGASHSYRAGEQLASAVGVRGVIALGAHEECRVSDLHGHVHTAKATHLDIKEDGGREDALERAWVSFATTSQKEGRSRPFAVSMASAIKTFLACSLLAFVMVHAGQRSHGRDTAVRQAISSPVVTVKNGSYEGLYSAEYDQDFFLGMRYAQVNHYIRILFRSPPSPLVLQHRTSPDEPTLTPPY